MTSTSHNPIIYKSPANNTNGIRKTFGPDGCQAVIDGVKCGETKNLQIIREFKQLYEDKMRQIDEIAGGDCIQAKVNLQQEWIKDLTDQNEMLVRVVEELEVEAAERVAMLESKLQQSAKCACEVMDSYSDFSFNFLGDLQKMEYVQSDLSNLLELIRRFKANGVWNPDGLRFYCINVNDIIAPGQQLPKLGTLPNCECISCQDELFEDNHLLQREDELKEKEKKIQDLEEQLRPYLENGKTVQDYKSMTQDYVELEKLKERNEYKQQFDESQEKIKSLEKEAISYKDAMKAQIDQIEDAARMAKKGNDYKDECEKYQSQIEALEKEIGSYKEETKKLKNEHIYQMDAALGDATKTINEVKKLCAEYLENIANLENEKVTLRKQLDAYQDELTRVKKCSDDYEHELEKLKQDADENVRELKRLKKDADDNEREMVKLKKDVDENEQELINLRKNAEENEREIKKLRKDADENERVMSRLKNDVGGHEQELEELRKDVAEKDQELIKLRKDADEKERVMAKLKNDVTGHEEELEGLRKDVEEKDQELTKLQKDAAENERTVAKLRRNSAESYNYKQELEELRKELDEKDEEMMKLRNRAEENERVMVKFRNGAEGHEQQLEQLKKDVAEKDQELIQLRKDAAENERTAAKLRRNSAESCNYKQELEELKKDLDEKDEELMKLRKRAEENERVVAKFRNGTEGHEQELEQLKKDVAEKDQELIKLRQDAAENEKELNGYKETILRMEQRLSESKTSQVEQAEKKEILDLCAEYVEKIRTLEKENLSYKEKLMPMDQHVSEEERTKTLQESIQTEQPVLKEVKTQQDNEYEQKAAQIERVCYCKETYFQFQPDQKQETVQTEVKPYREIPVQSEHYSQQEMVQTDPRYSRSVLVQLHLQLQQETVQTDVPHYREMPTQQDDDRVFYSQMVQTDELLIRESFTEPADGVSRNTYVQCDAARKEIKSLTQLCEKYVLKIEALQEEIALYKETQGKLEHDGDLKSPNEKETRLKIAQLEEQLRGVNTKLKVIRNKDEMIKIQGDTLNIVQIELQALKEKEREVEYERRRRDREVENLRMTIQQMEKAIKNKQLNTDNLQCAVDLYTNSVKVLELSEERYKTEITQQRTTIVNLQDALVSTKQELEELRQKFKQDLDHKCELLNILDVNIKDLENQCLHYYNQILIYANTAEHLRDDNLDLEVSRNNLVQDVSLLESILLKYQHEDRLSEFVVNLKEEVTRLKYENQINSVKISTLQNDVSFYMGQTQGVKNVLKKIIGNCECEEEVEEEEEQSNCGDEENVIAIAQEVDRMVAGLQCQIGLAISTLDREQKINHVNAERIDELQNIISVKNLEIKRAIDANNDMKVKYEAVASRSRKLEEAVKELQEHLAGSELDQQFHEQKVDICHEELDICLNNLNCVKQKLRCQCQMMSQKVKELTELKADFKVQSNNTEMYKRDLECTRIRYREEVIELKHLIRDLTDKLNSAEQKNNGLNEEIKHAQTQLVEMTQHETKLQQETAAKEQEFNKQMHIWQTEESRLLELVASLEEQLQHTQDDLAGRSVQIDAAKSKIQQMSTDVHMRYQMGQEELVAAKNEINHLRQAHEKLRLENEKLLQQLQMLKTNVHQHENLNSTVKMQLDKCMCDLKRIEADKYYLEQKNEKLVEELDKLQTVLRNRCENLMYLEEELQVLKSNRDEIRKESHHVVCNVRAWLEEQKKINDQLKEKLIKKNALIVKYQQEQGGNGCPCAPGCKEAGLRELVRQRGGGTAEPTSFWGNKSSTKPPYPGPWSLGSRGSDSDSPRSSICSNSEWCEYDEAECTTTPMDEPGTHVWIHRVESMTEELQRSNRYWKKKISDSEFMVSKDK